MTKEEIKNELIKRFKSKYPKLEDIDVDIAPNVIADVLNDIISDKLSEEQKEDLLTFLKPVNLYLITAAIKGY